MSTETLTNGAYFDAAVVTFIVVVLVAIWLRSRVRASRHDRHPPALMRVPIDFGHDDDPVVLHEGMWDWPERRERHRLRDS